MKHTDLSLTTFSEQPLDEELNVSLIDFPLNFQLICGLGNPKTSHWMICWRLKPLPGSTMTVSLGNEMITGCPVWNSKQGFSTKKIKCEFISIHKVHPPGNFLFLCQYWMINFYSFFYRDLTTI